MYIEKRVITLYISHFSQQYHINIKQISAYFVVDILLYIQYNKMANQSIEF